MTGALSLLSDVRAVADRLLERCDRIDVRVHNAGVWPTLLVRTADALEESFTVNHLTTFWRNASSRTARASASSPRASMPRASWTSAALATAPTSTTSGSTRSTRA